MVVISERDREYVEGFLEFIEDSAATDDRYGTASRRNSDDGAVAAARFHIGGPCWLEVTLDMEKKQLGVGFTTEDREVMVGIDELLTESGQSGSEFVGAGFVEAGLRPSQPVVERFERGNAMGFSTAVPLEELSDLDGDAIRDRTLRMLEGLLIAFGPAAFAEADATDDDWDEDD